MCVSCNFILVFYFDQWSIFNLTVEIQLGDIQKVSSLKILEFWTPLPPCSSLLVLEHPPPARYVCFG